MPDSDFIIYVDESGDHGLATIDPTYPVFVLSFCIFEKSAYAKAIVPELMRLKFDFFGHDMVVLHSREIRKATGPFTILKNAATRAQFVQRVNDFVDNSDFTLISAIVRKQALIATYKYPNNPYELALLFCMERAYAFLRDRGQHSNRTHLVVEARGDKEDRDLELEFRRIVAGANNWGKMAFDIHFVPKAINSCGLQIADLVGHPIGRHVIAPNQPNRAYSIVEKKFRRDPWGKNMADGYGRKVFP